MPIHENLVLDRKTIHEYLEANTGLLILKFGATWCEPCKRIEGLVHDEFAKLSADNVTCATIDIDDSFDLYAYLKARKVVKSIPAVLVYVTGNTTIYPDDIVNTSDNQEVAAFFSRCRNMLNNGP